jgi:hypothetical protein
MWEYPEVKEHITQVGGKGLTVREMSERDMLQTPRIKEEEKK